MSRPRPALLALCLLLSAACAAPAEESRRDRDEARAAVTSGAILPLGDIVAGPRDRVSGEIVKVKLEREQGVWVYEFRVLDRQGRPREVTVDAATGAVRDAGGE